MYSTLEDNTRPKQQGGIEKAAVETYLTTLIFKHCFVQYVHDASSVALSTMHVRATQHTWH
eukprot:4702-Heterococcus_DN1.PRE.2